MSPWDHPSWASPKAPHWDSPIPWPLPDPNSVIVPAARAGETGTSAVITVETARMVKVRRRIAGPLPQGRSATLPIGPAPAPVEKPPLRLGRVLRGEDADLSDQARSTSVPAGTL